MKVGIIGCGNIGTELAVFLDKDQYFSLEYLFDISEDSIENLLKKLQNKPKVVEFENLMENSDLIIEAANKEVVEKIINNVKSNNKKILIMSTGGIIKNLELLKKIKAEIYLTSGAIAGLEAIKAVSGKISELTLTTTKPLKGLEGAPFIIKNNIDLNQIKNKETIFEGNLEEAIEGFPKNINVAATLFLASEFKNLKIKIIADPDLKTNNHEIFCKGEFGVIKTRVENLPSENPKTSYLAVLSAMQVLRNLSGNVKIGA